MIRTVLSLCAIVLVYSAPLFADEHRDSSSSYNLVLVFVDFKDGRKPDGSIPVTDADLRYFNDTTINAVGSMGYVNINANDPPDPRSSKRRMIRKYTYDDYWDMYFSVGTYYGRVHPDYMSHGIQAYGSLRDYYNEATYGKVRIFPAQTYRGPPDKYHTGIANRIDTAGGKTYVRWILISPTKKSSDYVYPSPEVLDDARAAARAFHALPESDSNYIPFDIDAYLKASPGNKVVYVGPGGAKSGYARSMLAQDIWLTEKPGAYGRSNAFPASTLEGIQGCAHEFAHLLGVQHFLGGSYDPMSWGGTGPDSTYNWFDYCPPHFNPWTKLTMGWIPAKNVIRVARSRKVTLPAIDRAPVVALITIYGDAGRDNDYSHSEYFIVEYRRREGFNRFAGGVTAGNFSGGALIWHYTSYHPFPVTGQIVENRLGLTVKGYGMGLKGKPGNPSDFFASGHALLDGSTAPNSNSAGNWPTGIRLSGFSVKHGKLTFQVTYMRGGIPKWDEFFTARHRPSGRLKGDVYVESPGSSSTQLEMQDCDLYLSPGSSLASSLEASRSQIHLLEDASLTISGRGSLSGTFVCSGTGTLTLAGDAAIDVAKNSSVSFGSGTRLILSPGAKFLCAPGARVSAKGFRTSPNSGLWYRSGRLH